MQNYVIFVEKDFLKSLLMIRIIEKLQTIVIIQVDIEAQPTVFVI